MQINENGKKYIYSSDLKNGGSGIWKIKKKKSETEYGLKILEENCKKNTGRHERW